jgi:hypothetical protein
MSVLSGCLGPSGRRPLASLFAEWGLPLAQWRQLLRQAWIRAWNDVPSPLAPSLEEGRRAWE